MAADRLTMTNDEAQDWLLAQHNAAPGPPDPARFGAAIRAIRAKAIADAKEWYLPDYPALPVSPKEPEPDTRFAKALTEYGVHHGNCPLDSWNLSSTRCKCGLFALIKEANRLLRADQPPSKGTPE